MKNTRVLSMSKQLSLTCLGIAELFQIEISIKDRHLILRLSPQMNKL